MFAIVNITHYSTVLLTFKLSVIFLQLIYDFKDGGGSFGLITLNPEKVPEEDRVKFSKIGVLIPSMR